MTAVRMLQRALPMMMGSGASVREEPDPPGRPVILSTGIQEIWITDRRAKRKLVGSIHQNRVKSFDSPIPGSSGVRDGHYCLPY
jgi:hypothetical protein